MAKSNKKTHKNDLKDRLENYRQIKLNVVGRKTGNTISIPVWFVFEDEELYLLPVRGSDTQWYRNIEKYGASDVKKYYSKFDVAVLAEPV